MPNYRVLINDNAHYMDEGERADYGVFANAGEAVAACKEIVDDELNTMWKPGMIAADLYRLYVAFGPDPFIVPLNPSDPDVRFSAWTYAKGRCKELVSVHGGYASSSYQCSRNTPSMARISAGLMSLECATVTAKRREIRKHIVVLPVRAQSFETAFRRTASIAID